jgi:hypothetical protein
MNAYKNASYAGLVICLFGIIITVYGFSFLLQQNELETNGIRVKGTVVDINEKAIYRSPFVKFETTEGDEFTFLSEFEVNVDLFTYFIGQEVDVIYNKENPSQAKIDAFWESNFEQGYLGILGVFLILFGWFWRKFLLKKGADHN